MMSTCWVVVGFAERVALFDEAPCFLDCWLEAITSIKISYIFIDCLEIDTKSNVELSLFDLSIDHFCIFDCIVTSDQVELIYSSSL